MARVESKNLFNYRPNGVPMDYVTKMSEMRDSYMKTTEPGVKDTHERLMAGDETVAMEGEYLEWMRNGLDKMTKFTDAYKDGPKKCIQSEFKVPIRDGNDYEVPVLVHTPKEIAGNKANAAVIYAHGGGVIAGNAEQLTALLSQTASDVGVVYFNVDYRLAPETKCPKNALDFYCAVKHIKEHAEEFNIDPSRIAIGGMSGGGYIVFATMVMMAQRNETNLVKLAIPGIAMISDYCFSDPAAMTQEERQYVYLWRKTWQCIADDFEAQRYDPLLFPDKASDELISKMPPTIIWEMEFDMFITENTRMAHRMRRMGRLLEFRVQPGMDHISAAIHGAEGNADYQKDFKLMIKEYLL